MAQIIKTLFFAAVATFIAFSLIAFPDQAFEASIRGLNMWWEIVFPSLLPFFITAELLIAFGVVKFVGVLFEPVMRPLFRVPGVGSFSWIMGMASGYPTGAKIAVRLREEKELTRIEAERLVAFTNASSPLFIFGAISIGFFHDMKLGLLLAASHYIGNMFVGLCMRFYGKNDNEIIDHTRRIRSNENNTIIRALREMHRERLRNKQPLGEIVSNAVINSIKTLVMVGGFIVLFSVFTKILFLVGLSPIIANGFKILFHTLHLPEQLALPFVSGIFEITLGAQMISQISLDHLLGKILITSFILGFNGFSVQSQVASIISTTDIRFKPYFIGRILHGIFASILTFILYQPLYLNRQVIHYQDTPVSHQEATEMRPMLWNLLTESGPMITMISIAIAIILLMTKNKTSK